jgi:SAV_6107-like HEPN
MTRAMTRGMTTASEELLRLSAHGLADAAVATTSAERYAAAHLAALRAAAAVLAARARPTLVRRKPSSVWVLLPAVAPELGEWSAFFAAGAAKRAAAEAGLERVVTPREADDLVRNAAMFLALVETTLGYSHQPALEVGAYPLTG